MTLDKSKILKNAVESSLYQYPHQNMSLIDMTGEVWKPVPDYEDYYQVSNLGRIKSLERRVKLNLNSGYSYWIPPQIIKQRLRIHASGIKSLTARLYVEKAEIHITVKNLVYNAFVKNVNVRDYQVFPLDGEEENCRVTNLDSRPRRRRDRKLQAIQEKWEKEVCSRNYPFQNLSLEDMPEEIWKPMPGFEELYLVSNMGRVKLLPKKMEGELISGKVQYETSMRIRRQTLIKSSGLCLVFSVFAGKRDRLTRTSHAVYSAFMCAVDTKKYRIAHKDGDSLNNRLENLYLKLKKKKFVPILNPDITVNHGQTRNRSYKRLQEVELTSTQKSLLNNNQYPFQNLSLENMEGEVWKKVAGYEKYLEISNYGRVKRLPRFVMNDENGYWTEEKIGEQVLRVSHGALDSAYSLCSKLEVTYMDDKGEKQFFRNTQTVARMVYSAFVKPIRPKERKSVVGFKDGDPLNSRLDNLCIKTLSELQKKFYNQMAISDKISRGKSSTERIISQYDLRGNYITTYTSLSDAARSTGIKQPSCISKVLNGKSRSAGGFLWKAEGADRKDLYEETLQKHKPEIARARSINQYDLNEKFLASFDSITQAARKFGYNRRNLNDHLLKQTPSFKGYIWRYADNKN